MGHESLQRPGHPNPRALATKPIMAHNDSSGAGAPLLKHRVGSTSVVPLPYVAVGSGSQPCETGTAFLSEWRADPRDADAPRSDEPWSDLHEKLLQDWAEEWTAAQAAHSAAETRKKCLHRCFQIPNVLIPIVLAPMLAAKVVSEDQLVVIMALVLAGVTGGVMSVMGWERVSEQHAQAAFRYADLLSDAEELMAKQRRFRPRCDVTMQRFKMRMDNASKLSPPVSVPPKAASPGAPRFGSGCDGDNSSSEEAAVDA